MLPSTVTVGLVLSLLTMTRSLLGSIVSVHVALTVGTRSAESADSAQSGSLTGLVGAAVNCSPPPNPFPDAASSVGFGTQRRGDRVRVLEVLLRDTIHVGHGDAPDRVDVIVGRVSPSAASACDQTAARSEIELRRNCADAISDRFAASTSSAGNPWRT